MSYTVAARLDEFPVGQSRIVQHGENFVAVFHTEEGVFAVQNDCPHAWAPLASGSIDGCQVTCPLHGWSFDVRDGSPVDAPPNATLRRYAIDIVDGEVRVAGEDEQAGSAS